MPDVLNGPGAPDFRQLFESAPGLYLVLTPDLTIVAASDEYLRATMTKRDEILGRPLFEVFPDNPDDNSPTGERNLSASLQRVLTNRAADTMPVQKYDVRRPQSEGGAFEERFWSPVNSPVLGANGEISYIIHRVEDVTEFVRLKHLDADQQKVTEELRVRTSAMEAEILKRSQELIEANQKLRDANEELATLYNFSYDQLSQNRNLLAQIVDSSSDAIIGKDLEGTITSWNKGAEHIYGYTAAEIVGQPVRVLVPESKRQELEAILERVRKGEATEHLETERRAKDGSILNVSISVSPIREAGGKLIGASTIARDVTSQKRLENQLQHAQKMKAIGQLAGGLAHDFNNVLSIITCCTELLRSRIDGNGELISHIFEASKRGASLTRQLLSVTRSQPSSVEVFAPPARLNDLCKLLRPLLGDDVAVVLEPRSNCVVEMDPGQFDQIVLNLAVNARHAMPSGGKLLIETNDVTMDEELAGRHPPLTPGSYLRLAVSDTGCGMDEATRARIFEPFFTTKEFGKGTGLGLTTVFGIVQQNKGHIWVYSEPDRGTTFRIYIPVADHKVYAAERADQGTLPAKRENVTILLAEDDPGLRSLTREMLEDYGYLVLEAEDGVAALAAVAENSTHIDLTLTDVVMKGMSGPDLVRKVTAQWPRMRFVYMSGYTGSLLSDRGAEDKIPLLEKPFTRAALLRTIDAALS